MQKARVLAEEKLIDFINSMRRRLRRDVKNSREYYDALRKREWKQAFPVNNLSEAQRQERIAKIEDLPREMAQKIEDLQQKYKIQVRLKAMCRPAVSRGCCLYYGRKSASVNTPAPSTSSGIRCLAVLILWCVSNAIRRHEACIPV